MNDQESAVVVKDLYKSFKLPHEQSSGLKQLVVNFTNRTKGFETQTVLKDVSFEIKKGEFYGIVGRNGSGKSTLLKLLAGIYAPDKGIVQVNGSLTPFIELGVGFNPELTGRENLYLNGALLGFNRTEMDVMYDDIVTFAELEQFMDQKLKNYSSGMQVRLAFSIAIRSESDILLIDEVLAVGDEAFQRKCFEYFYKLKKSHRTIILISHDMNSVRRFCDRALLIHDGKVVLDGDTNDVTMKYLELNSSNAADNDIVSEDPLQTKSVRVEAAKKIIKWGDDVTVDIHIDKYPKSATVIGLSLINTDRLYVAGINSNHSIKLDRDRSAYKCIIDTANVGPGEYTVGVSLMTGQGEVLSYNLNGPLLQITGSHPNKDGIVMLNAKWK